MPNSWTAVVVLLTYLCTLVVVLLARITEASAPKVVVHSGLAWKTSVCLKCSAAEDKRDPAGAVNAANAITCGFGASAVGTCWPGKLWPMKGSRVWIDVWNAAFSHTYRSALDNS